MGNDLWNIFILATWPNDISGLDRSEIDIPELSFQDISLVAEEPIRNYSLPSKKKVKVTNLFLNHFPVNFSGRYVVIPGQGHIKITFIISQIQIDLPAIVEDKDFPLIPTFKTIVFLSGPKKITMFCRSYRPSIDIHIRVYFNSSDFKPSCLQEQAR